MRRWRVARARDKSGHICSTNSRQERDGRGGGRIEMMVTRAAKQPPPFPQDHNTTLGIVLL